MARKDKDAAAKKWDEMRDKIQAVQKSVAYLKQSGIREKVLYWLIQKNSQRFTELRNNPIKIDDVRAIMQGIATLEEYVFPRRAKKPAP